MNFAMATLGLKEMEKFLWEGREKSLPSCLSQFSDILPYECKIVFNVTNTNLDQKVDVVLH